jgi:FkbM family methyltransferase
MMGRGMIFAFEPMPQNYEMLVKNAEKIPNCKAVNLGLGCSSGKLNFAFGGDNSGASRMNANGEVEVDVVTLDEFVEDNHIQKVDFIKADIEGGECDMLRGAENTIGMSHPKLAVCIYHRGLIDHWEVPRTILSINPNYKFYMLHYSHGYNETVLYCEPTEERPVFPDVDTEQINMVGELYKSVHMQLVRRVHTHLYDSVIRQAEDITGIPLKWEYWGTGKWAAAALLSENRNIYYKIFPHMRDVSVELVFDRFSDYSEAHRTRFMEILNAFAQKHGNFKVHDAGRGLWGGLPVPRLLNEDISETAALWLAALISETVFAINDMGLITSENAKYFLKQERVSR